MHKGEIATGFSSWIKYGVCIGFSRKEKGLAKATYNNQQPRAKARGYWGFLRGSVDGIYV